MIERQININDKLNLLASIMYHIGKWVLPRVPNLGKIIRRTNHRQAIKDLEDMNF